MSEPAPPRSRPRWADAGSEEEDNLWQTTEKPGDERTQESAGVNLLIQETAENTANQCSQGEPGSWGGWHPYSDSESNGFCFLKLIDGDTGAVIDAKNSEELRLIALKCAKADDYIKGTLYFLQTRIVPCTSNKRRCKKHAVKWYVDNAQKCDQKLSYYKE